MKKILTLLFVMILISQNVCFADNLAQKVDVTLTQVPIASKLKKAYNGYRYTITNNSGQNLNIVNAQVLNAVNGSVAYQTVDDGHPIGITWAICGPVGLITLGIGWLAGIVATPIVWVVSESNSKKARIESIAYSNIINLGEMNTGESITTEFLVPIGAKPQLKMTVQPEKTKDLVNINSL